MHRIIVTGLVSVAACLGLAGVAQAQDPVVPPAFVPPGPAPVTDVATAEAFAEGYATRNAWRFLRESPRRVRVVDANAACLAHPVVADRYGCVFTLRALVLERRHRGWWKWDGHKSPTAAPASRRGGDDRRGHRRFRIRTFGCLGLLSVTGGAAVTPSGTVRFVECARVPRGDIVAPEPVA